MPAASLSPARPLSASSGSRFSTNLPTPRVGTNTGEGSAFVGKWHRVSVGSVELVALQDTFLAVPPDEFFVEVEAGAWEAYGDLLSAAGELSLSITPWLIRSEGRTILVDTGFGGRPTAAPVGTPPALPSVLAEAGVSPEEVDVVAFTHLHGDHVGWNTVDREGRPVPLFPNARHVVQQAEWDYWANGGEIAPPDRPTVLDPISDAGLWEFVEGERALTGEVVTVPTPGHTPGHVSLVVSSGGESAVLIGDAAHSPIQVSEPEWSVGADVDRALARRTRAALWERAEREGQLVATNHFPFPGLGHVVSEGGRRRWKGGA